MGRGAVSEQETGVFGPFNPIQPVAVEPPPDWGNVEERVLHLLGLYNELAEGLLDPGTSFSFGAVRDLLVQIDASEKTLGIAWDDGTPRTSPRRWGYRVC